MPIDYDLELMRSCSVVGVLDFTVGFLSVGGELAVVLLGQKKPILVDVGLTGTSVAELKKHSIESGKGTMSTEGRPLCRTGVVVSKFCSNSNGIETKDGFEGHLAQ